MGATPSSTLSFNRDIRPILSVPTLKQPEANPIDAFIGAAIERAPLKRAPEADRRTIIRRLSFDLIGLPPEPRDVETFAASRDPQAYARLVQQFLASLHFGERIAIPWLDLVRYADTIGFPNDVAIRYWPYRDYVINAFNRNLPFDQFTREQLAGDLLPGSTIEQRVGSGYNRLHRISGEGGIQDKEYFAKYAADRVRTTATVWMGSTLACAECHDHKFDPFTAKDFYRVAAIFSDLKEKGACSIALGALLQPRAFGAPAAPAGPWRGLINPLHHAAKIKRVIYLYQAGGPSHLKLFDFKPKLRAMHGQPMPESFTQGQQIAQLQGRELKCYRALYDYQRFGK